MEKGCISKQADGIVQKELKNMERWVIDFEMLKRTQGKCLCGLDEYCPCEDFIYRKECRCGIFKKVEEDIKGKKDGWKNNLIDF